MPGFALAFLFILPPQQATPVDLAGVFKSGEQALARNDLPAAERAFRHVAAADPKSAGAHANLGVVYMRQRAWGRALQELLAAERLAPDVAGIRLNIGITHYRRNDFRAAIAPFESVVREQPGSAQARQLLGFCYFFEERYADAASTLAPLWPQESGDLMYLYVLAIAAGKGGRADLEQQAMARMVDIGKDTAEFHLFLGKAYIARQDDDSALAELEKAEAANSKLPFVHYNLGLVYRRKNELERAKAEFLKDAAIEPDVAYNYDQLGGVCYLLNQEAESERFYKEAVRWDPRMASAHFGLAKIYKQRGSLAQALAAAESAAKLDPDSASVRYLKGQILWQIGRKQEAENEFATSRRLRQAVRDRLEREVSGDPQLTVKEDRKVGR